MNRGNCRRAGLVVVVCIGAVFGLVAAPLASVADASTAAPWGYTAAPRQSHSGQRSMPLGPRPQAATPGQGHLSYGFPGPPAEPGGPVISSVAVQSVYWGTGTYEEGVLVPPKPCPASGPCTMNEFFQGVTDSTHLDWLSEYNTAGLNRMPGLPAQAIGRGRFIGQSTISVSPANAGTSCPNQVPALCVSDTNIQNELDRQLTSGALAPPQLDNTGQVKTVYAMFFPSSVTITEGNSVGGETGGFCAYHGTITHHSATLNRDLAVPYMVMPDFETHRFADGCGVQAAPLFDNFTATTAHELVESITDPAVGLGPPVGGPAWLDFNTGMEIADICQFIDVPQGQITGGNNLDLVVQMEFSNRANKCILTGNVPAPTRTGYVAACGLAGRSGFTDAGLAADCLKQYGISQGKNDGTFGENDGLVRSQVSSLLSRLVELSGGTLTQSRAFPDVNADTVPNAQVRNEIELLAGSGIIAGFPDGQFHPTDNLSVAQAVALVTRTMQFIHAFNPNAPNIVEQGSTEADYQVAANIGLLDFDATNIRGFVYSAGVGDVTDRGLLADVLAQAVQRLVDKGVVSAA